MKSVRGTYIVSPFFLREARKGWDTWLLPGRLHILHFFGRTEAQGLIEGPARVGTVQCYHANAPSVCLGHAAFYQGSGQAAPPVLRGNEDVQHVTAMLPSRIMRVRWPVQNQKASRGSG